MLSMIFSPGFNPRTYIRYDGISVNEMSEKLGFNPRTYIRYDFRMLLALLISLCFNPRTYIRYDFHVYSGASPDALFQSTYLYKVRPN